MKSGCDFCDEIGGKLEYDRFVMETDNFVVFPSKGGFVINYLLIVSKIHYTCMGDLSVEEMDELSCIISKLKKINTDLGFKSSILFEHGGRSDLGNSGTSITHAHLHIMPSDISCLDEIRDFCKDIQMIHSIKNLPEVTKQKETYLYYQDIDSKNYVVFHSGVPSQFIRRIICTKLDLENMWDWRQYPMESAIEQTIKLWKENNY